MHGLVPERPGRGPRVRLGVEKAVPPVTEREEGRVPVPRHGRPTGVYTGPLGGVESPRWRVSRRWWRTPSVREGHTPRPLPDVGTSVALVSRLVSTRPSRTRSYKTTVGPVGRGSEGRRGRCRDHGPPCVTTGDAEGGRGSSRPIRPGVVTRPTTEDTPIVVTRLPGPRSFVGESCAGFLLDIGSVVDVSGHTRQGRSERVPTPTTGPGRVVDSHLWCPGRRHPPTSAVRKAVVVRVHTPVSETILVRFW